MSSTRTMNRFISILLFVFTYSIAATAQTTSFSYQGKLTDNGTPANGTYQSPVLAGDERVFNRTGPWLIRSCLAKWPPAQSQILRRS